MYYYIPPGGIILIPIKVRISAAILFSTLAAFNPVTAFSSELPIPPLLRPEILADGTRLFELEARYGSREFFEGRSTPTLGYNGDYLGPTIRVKRGDKVVIRVTNSLRESTTVHWHGADVPAESDGGPHQGIAPGTVWDAPFTVKQGAATLWYHPHFMGTTAGQVYMGLAGLLIVDEASSPDTGLPDEYGVDDIPLILQERRFEPNGRFRYTPSMPDVMHGYFGNELLVNGAVTPVKEVERKAVRLRLLNGSNSSLLRISFEGLRQVHQVASDGGYLASPVELSQIILSPGERAEVIADFSLADAEAVALVAESNGGRTYRAMEFRLAGARTDTWNPPAVLAPVPDIPASEAAVTRSFALASGMGGRMTINGRTMDMNRIDQRVKLGDTEIWEIVNSNRGMMNQPHSFHVHAVQFRVLDINGRRPPPELSGWKDTVLLWPGDKVRIIARFDSYKGLYMFHCHLLEHEDNGMMGQFLIE